MTPLAKFAIFAALLLVAAGKLARHALLMRVWREQEDWARREGLPYCKQLHVSMRERWSLARAIWRADSHFGRDTRARILILLAVLHPVAIVALIGAMVVLAWMRIAGGS